MVPRPAQVKLPSTVQRARRPTSAAEAIQRRSRRPPAARLDRTLALLLEGYMFISAATRAAGSPILLVRLLGRRTALLTGATAAELFYESGLVRAGAAPRRMRRTLIGDAGVQTLDGERHRLRKAMFLDIASPSRVEELVSLVEEEWYAALPRWQDNGDVDVLTAVGDVLTAAACRWVGLDVPSETLPALRRDIHSLIESGGLVGPPHWRGRLARRRLERWAEAMVNGVRRQPSSDASALESVASFREVEGAPLPARVAAVELLNIIRPVVAIDRYVACCVHALAVHPDQRPGDDAEIARFVQEVRRCYPFFPAALARAARPWPVMGYVVPAGTRVMLDLFGTGMDPQVWEHPERFDPDRFMRPTLHPYSLIPQGGGDPRVTHRCPGEGATVAVMEASVRLLLGQMSYVVPSQDLRVELSHIPVRPGARLRISDVRVRRTEPSP